MSKPSERCRYAPASAWCDLSAENRREVGMNKKSEVAATSLRAVTRCYCASLLNGKP